MFKILEFSFLAAFIETSTSTILQEFPRSSAFLQDPDPIHLTTQRADLVLEVDLQRIWDAIEVTCNFANTVSNASGAIPTLQLYTRTLLSLIHI